MTNWIRALFQKLLPKTGERKHTTVAEAILEAPSSSKVFENVPRRPEAENRRNEDMSAEAQLAHFMDKYLYSNFPNSEAFVCIQRVYDKKAQLNGIDVEFVGKDGSCYCVDEKAQLYYLNQDLPTFAFEIMFKRDGYDTTGWLCNNALKTDLYMLIWPFAVQDTPKGITWDKFTRADCLLIQKKRLLKMLLDKGLSIDEMLDDARKIRMSGKMGKIPIAGLRGIYYYASSSQRYSEAPINIVISKNILKSIAQRRYIVTKDHIELQ